MLPILLLDILILILYSIIIYFDIFVDKTVWFKDVACKTYLFKSNVNIIRKTGILEL